MKIEDLDSCNEAVSTDELILTHTNHTTEKITFEDLKESIGSVSELEITTELEVSGDTQLGDTTVTGDITQTGDAGITGDVTIIGAVDVTGDTDIDGDVTITGDLDITGDIVQRGSAYETHAEKVYTKDDVINLRDGAVAALGNDEYAGLIAKHYDADGNDGALVFNKNGEARVGDYTEVTGTVYSSDGITFYSDSEMTQAATIPVGATPVQVEGNEYTYTVMVDDTEPLLTRSEAASMTDKAIIVWDGTNKRAVTTSLPAAANKVPLSQADGSFTWTDYSTGNIPIAATSSVITGRTLVLGEIIKVAFINAITGSDAVTGLTLTINGDSYAVKVYKNGSFVNFTAVEIATNTFKYIQANSYIDLYVATNGTDLIILGNPIVISGDGYAVHADGTIEKDTEFYCNITGGGADDPEAQTGTTYSYSIGPDYGIKVGDVIKVTFAQALQSSSAITSVSLTCGGKTGDIVTVQPITTITDAPAAGYKWIASHEFTGGNYSSTYKHKVWDANTILELTWTGTYWLAKSEAVLCQYSSNSDADNYVIKANGLITETHYLTISSTLRTKSLFIKPNYKDTFIVTASVTARIEWKVMGTTNNTKLEWQSDDSNSYHVYVIVMAY